MRGMKVIKKQTNSADCIVCGKDNPNGIHASFYEMEDQSLIALFRYKFHHQSYPERVHGGMIAAMLDESIGRAIWIHKPGAYGCTLKLNIEYHKGVPYDTPLKCVAKITHIDRICFKGEAEIQLMDGTMLAKANALYMFLTLEQISPTTLPNEASLNIMEEDGVKEIN